MENDDVLTEVLLHLPAKSLMRFKSVCKKWRSLVSSDYFRHQYTLRGPKQSLILQHGSNPHCFHFNVNAGGETKVMIPYTLSRTGFPHRYNCKILQSCNGLLLLQANNNLYSFRRCLYRVYNPTTRQSTEINPSYQVTEDHVAAIGLAFDPSESPHYKVVCIMRCLDFYRDEVYDSESRSWRQSSMRFILPSGFDCSEPQYCNNAIFWWRTYGDTYYRFDIAKNEMEAFRFPQSQYQSYFTKPRSYLQELDGTLYYLALSFRTRWKGKLFAEVMELRGDEWLLKHDHRAVTCQEIGECVKLMRCDSDGSLQLIYHQSSGKRKMRAYSFLHKRSKDLVGFTPPRPFVYSDDDDDDDDVSRYSLNGPLYLLRAFQFRETFALV